MTDLLIRDIDPNLKSELEKRARTHGRSLSDEAKTLLGQAVNPNGPPPGVGMGTWMRSLLPPEYRGDDLVFERDDEIRDPPDFK